jgi:hypothetical protein
MLSSKKIVPSKGSSGLRAFLQQRQAIAQVPNILANQTCLSVPQKYWGYALGGHGITHIGTWGMGPCVGFALYRRESQCAGVAHFDSDAAESLEYFALSIAPALIRSFEELAGGPPTAAYIVPGSDVGESSQCLRQLLAVALGRMGYEGITTTGEEATSGAFVITLADGSKTMLGANAAPTSAEVAHNQFLHHRGLHVPCGIYRLKLPLVQSNRYEAP